jgi:thiol-disulfide isomerase/thioredoxin
MRKIIKTSLVIKLLIFFFITGALSCVHNSAKEKKKEKDLESLNKNIGEKFDIENFIDTSGSQIKLDFTKSEITIVDFWFNDCPPCNKEMSQFRDLIKGKDKQIIIVSISVSGYEFWKKLFTDKSDRYAFLTTSTPNWQHLNLKSNDDPGLKNTLSEDRLAELTTKLDVSFFPAYFVVNKDGVIKARPISAVEYIKQKL